MKQRSARCLALVVALVLGACSNGAEPHAQPERRRASGRHAQREQRRAKADCAPTRDVTSPTQAELHEVATSPRITAAVYPRPTYTAKQWSQWGQGVVLPDGTYLSALGDHCGRNGDSFLYTSDGRVIDRVADVDAVLHQHPGAWGYGKIHGQAVPMADGNVYFATYWGDSTDVEFGNGYDGDVILRYDPRTRDVSRVGVPVPKHGVPSLVGWADGGLLYGEAVDPTADKLAGTFFAFDVKTGKTVFTSDEARHDGFRSVAVTKDGRAIFSAGDRKLWQFDPGRRKLTELPGTLPGPFMRAATHPAPDGTIYGVTKKPFVLFALKPSGEITSLGEVPGYTASLALAPDGRHLYYVPFATGLSWKQGTPLVEVELPSGRQRDVVRLNDTVGKALHLTLGGSYNVAIDSKGQRVYVGLNGGPTTDDPFGEVVLAIVDVSGSG